jgi:hypothetical protein
MRIGQKLTMKRTRLTSVLFFSLTSIYVVGQTPAPPAIPKEYPLVSLGYGLTLFSGDVGRTNQASNAYRSAFRFGVEQRFNGWVGAELFGNYGKLSMSERSLLLNRNFESKFMFAGLNAVLYFDNDLIIKRNFPFSPYLTVGFGYMTFDPHGDLKDKNDSTYNYWADGSIHSAAENSPNASSSILLERDYTYETQLKDSLVNYSRSTFGVPIGVGFRWRFNEQVGVNVQANYFITFTDYIDNVKDGGNDHFLWIGGSFYYKFGKRDKEKNEGIDVNAMYHEDFDKDGVADINDQCEGTPAGVKVDHNGCPLDGDHDGVADYLDKEPNTKKGMKVDENGVALDYDKIREIAIRDSINEAQKDSFNLHPSQQTLSQGNSDIQAKNPSECTMPDEFRAADTNKDCVITADEINAVIDNFFDGVGNWTADSINRLIDYFFDQ